jgi:hypothetical protein
MSRTRGALGVSHAKSLAAALGCELSYYTLRGERTYTLRSFDGRTTRHPLIVNVRRELQLVHRRLGAYVEGLASKLGCRIERWCVTYPESESLPVGGREFAYSLAEKKAALERFHRRELNALSRFSKLALAERIVELRLSKDPR